MILKTHDLETFYSSYKIYINDKININFSHFIILQLDSIWRAASGAIDAFTTTAVLNLARGGFVFSPISDIRHPPHVLHQPPGRHRGACMVRSACKYSY